jgi:hypothetical protein
MKSIALIAILTIQLAIPVIGAENRVITGKISGMDNEPLVGTTVMVKSGEKSLGGVISNPNGRYSIRIATVKEDTLMVEASSIGYEGRLIKLLPVSDTSIVNFALREKPIELSTIVVSPKTHDAELMTTMSSEKIDLASRHSLITTNPISAIRQAQVVREGSSYSSKLRINGTSPVYYLNGIEMGYDPNHYGMFSIVPGSAIGQIRFFPQGTSAASGSPSIVEFGTLQPFESKPHSEMDLSFVEGTGSVSMGSSRYFLLSTVRKSVLDKIADKITPDSKQVTIPPTAFRDIFISGGIKVSNHLKLLNDNYDVKDYLSYNLGATSNNPGGINTYQNTGERFSGVRLEGLYKHLSFKLNGAVKESHEHYKATSIGSDTLSAFFVDLSSQSMTQAADFEMNILLGGTRITLGDNLNYVKGRQIRLHQTNWNFLPPDANSDSPFIYQRELNRYYGSYNSTSDQLNDAGYLSVKQTFGSLEIESGLRGEYFRDLGEKRVLLWRNSLLFRSPGFGIWGLSSGTYANSPINRILEPYQVLVQANLSKLRPVETNLSAINWSAGPFKFSAFKKDINYLPRLTPDFSQVSEDGTVGKNFLVMRPDGQINSYGGDVTFELNSFHGFDLFAFYGYSHAVKITQDVTVPYELNAPNKLFTELGYKVNHHLRIGGKFSLHTGFPYTRLSVPNSVENSNLYTESYYQGIIGSENSTRFPLNISSDLNADLNFGRFQIYANLSNIFNYQNPIINTADGFVYDAGILPSLGLSYKF